MSKANDLRLRHATTDDLDDLVTVSLAGLPDDDGFDYFFRYRHTYPDDTKLWNRKRYEEHLDQSEKYATLVVTAPVRAEDRGEPCHKPVAVAIWDVNVSVEGKHDLGLDGRRRDASKPRMEARKTALDTAWKKYFGKYGNNQYHLVRLIVHPNFRRRGVGSMLSRWGVEKADEKGYGTSVFASSMGKVLYEQLGFALLGSVTVKVDGEDEELAVYCMDYVKGEHTVEAT